MIHYHELYCNLDILQNMIVLLKSFRLKTSLFTNISHISKYSFTELAEVSLVS